MSFANGIFYMKMITQGYFLYEKEFQVENYNFKLKMKIII